MCRNVLEDCSEAWVSMVQMAADVKEYTRRLRTLHAGKDEDGILEEKGFTMNLDSFITNRNLIPILKSCRGKSLVKCPFEHVAALCEQFIHIQAPTYIESSQSQAQKILTSIKASEQVCNRHILLMGNNLEKIDLLRAQLRLGSNETATKELVWRSVKQLAQFRILRDSWISVQLQVPILKVIWRQKVSKGPLNILPKAIRSSDKLLTQIENTIAAAALKVHEVIRQTILNPISPDLKKQAERNWDLICRLVESIKFPTYQKPGHKQIFQGLGMLARKQHRLAVSSQHRTGEWLTAHHFFIEAVKLKFGVRLEKKRANRQERPTVEPSTVTPTNSTAQPSSHARLLSGMILDPLYQMAEIQVIENDQCNPCLSPAAPGILEGP